MVKTIRANLQISQVLRHLEVDLKKYAAGINGSVGGSMAYCLPCNTFTLVSDDYSRHVGRNMGRKKEQDQCVHCDGVEFVSVSPLDLRQLRQQYQADSPEVVVLEGIDSALRKMPLGYNCQTDVYDKWASMNYDERFGEILELFRRQDELSVAEMKLRVASKRVRELEEAF